MPKLGSGERTGTFADLKDALQIDKLALDDAWVELPDLFWRVSEAYTMACSDRDELKLELGELRASLSSQYRAEAESAGKKTSVDSINAEVENSPKYADLQREYSDLVAKAAKWAALKEAYGTRRDALKGLTQLYASNYFSIDAGSRPRSAAVDSVAERNRLEAGTERQNRPTRLRPTPRD